MRFREEQNIRRTLVSVGSLCHGTALPSVCGCKDPVPKGDLLGRRGGRSSALPPTALAGDRHHLRDLDADPDQQKFGRYPLYLFEVLSPSSAHIDMGAKLAEYQGLSSVQGVFLIDPTGRTVTAFLRGSSGEWPATGSMVEEGGTVMLAAVGIRLRWDEIFAD